MPQYLLAVHGPAEQPDIADPSQVTPEMQQAFEAVDRFNTDLQERGAWVFAGGLQPVSSATVVDGTGDTVTMTDGPYAETKEVLGGFWVIEVADLDAALEIAAAGSKACRNPVEVRPFQDEPAS